MSGTASKRPRSPLVEAALLTARLSAAERRTVFAALADAGEVAGALRYLRQTPAMLSSGLDLQDFYAHLGVRWETSAEVARDICALYSMTANDTVARQIHSGLAPPAPQPAAEPTPVPEASVPTPTPPVPSAPPAEPPPRSAGDQLDPGTPLPAPNTGDQLTDTPEQPEQLDAAQLMTLRQDITAIQAQVLAENLEPAELRVQVGAMAEGFSDDSVEVPSDKGFSEEEIRDLERRYQEQKALVYSAWGLVQALSDEQLLNLFTMDPESDDPSLFQLVAHAESINALSLLMQARAIGAALSTEINRLRGPGFKWTFPALQEKIQSLGYEGPDISDPEVLNTLDLRQAGNVLGYLRNIRSAYRPARKAAPVNTDPDAPPKASLSKRKERIEYIETLLDRNNGVVYTNQLSGPFGVNGTSVSSLLKEYGYDAMGNGAYRRKRLK